MTPERDHDEHGPPEPKPGRRLAKGRRPTEVHVELVSAMRVGNRRVTA